MRLLQNFVSRRDARPGHRSDVDSESSPHPGVGQHALVLETIAMHSEAGRFGDALGLIDETLAKNPDDFDFLFARASLLFSWWRYAEAYEQLVDIGNRGSKSGPFHLKLGWTCFWLNRLDEAAESMRRAVACDPDDWSTHFGRAIALRAQKRPAASRAEFERVLALKPDDPHSISNLVACDVELGHIDRAERYASQAVARDPENPSAIIDLGIVQCEQMRYADAVAAFERADDLGISITDARDESVNYAICLLRAGRAGQAIRMMESKLRQYPSAALHSHYALALLTAGRMREGWAQYEFRWLQEPLLSWRPKFVKPVWDGQDLRGKTILLRAEQGYGDFIQFIRYARHVKALGATVLLEVREELRELAATASGIDRILLHDEPLPHFDYYINLLSIPRILGTDLASVPAEVPYLRASSDRAAQWKDTIRDDGVFNVGLVWAGSPTHLGDRFRSLALRDLAPLRAIKGVKFHSLQKGPGADELVTDCGHDPIVELGSKLATFADTAAAIEALDLVISVDTSVVHLAGAMGKPVWTLVAIPGDWRWLEGRQDSPWYPTMRLFRQREAGAGWGDVIDEVASALAREVECHGRGAGPAPMRPPVQPGHVEVVRGAAQSPTADLCRVAETRVGIMMFWPRDAATAMSIERYGECLHLQLELIERMLKPGMTVLEVGAGIGVHSIPIAAGLGEKGHLFLYEDDGVLKHVLHENLRGNRISNATVMRRSLARSATTDVSDVRSEHSTWGIPESEAAAPRTETIDELRLQRLDLLKINERADPTLVAQGATATLRRLRPRLFIAVSNEQALEDVAAVIAPLRYACWKAAVPMFNPANFNGRDVDVFEGRKSLALVAVPAESADEVDKSGVSFLSSATESVLFAMPRSDR